jgi:hypothetical protein
MQLIRHHREICKGDCGVSLFMVRLFLEDLGVELSDEEQSLFF